MITEAHLSRSTVLNYIYLSCKSHLATPLLIVASFMLGAKVKKLDP